MDIAAIDFPGLQVRDVAALVKARGRRSETVNLLRLGFPGFVPSGLSRPGGDLPAPFVGQRLQPALAAGPAPLRPMAAMT